MTRYFTAILSFCFCTLCSFGQNRFGRVNHYDELNGTTIMDLLSDENGELWIATFSGLFTFDGYRFRNFYPDQQDSTTIDNLLLYSLQEDSRGDIWIGSMNQIYRHDAKTGVFQNYPLNELVDYPLNAQAMVFNIESDRHGALYFGIFSGTGYREYPGLLKYTESDQKFEIVRLPNGEPVQNVYQMATGPGGEIALISNQGFMIIRPDGTTYTDPAFERISKFPWLNQEQVTDIVWDDQGNLWFTTNLWRFGKMNPALDSVELKSFQTPFNGNPDWTRIDFDGSHIWISHRSGIELFNVGEDRFDTPANLDVKPFSTLHKDAMGNIWLGTSAYGLYNIPPRQSLTSYLHNPNDPASVTAGWVNNPFEDEQGNIWFPTTNWAGEEGLNKVDPRTGEIEKFLFREKLPQFPNLVMINAYDKGRFIFLSDKRLYGYDVNTGKVVDPHILSDAGPLDGVNYIYRDSKGVLWICTFSGLYRQTDDGYSLYDFSKGEMGQVTSNEVLQVMESQRGGMWVQTNEGLFFLNPETDELERHGFDPKKGPVFSSQDINSLLEDEDGTLWVGTWQGGLNRYDPNTGEIKYYGVRDGLPSPSIQGILEDKANDVLWLSTFRGIARFDKGSETFTSYGNEEGAQSLYADRASLHMSNGLFVFGGSNGITIFDPADFAKETRPPITRITGLKAGEESVPLSEGEVVSLDHSQNNLSITYTGIHYDNPSNNQFAYKLSPVDDDWREVGGARAAYFYDLKPGEYTFSVRAANPNGEWSVEKTIAFSIAPPWWQTPWAYVAYALLLAFVGYQTHRFQRQRTLRKERERNQARELEHAREIEKAYEQLKATQTQLIQSEKMASLGELTAGIAHEIQNPLNFVNNFSEVNRELIQELKEETAKEPKERNAQLEQELLTDIDQNLEKITHHGKRADGIVKGMLQHSRSGDGKKEPTDLNKLADEYLRLAYHGLRAKDKSFNASMETDFDPKLPQVSVVPQEIGRVLLNLLTNAFHAVSEKKKEAPVGYEPTVTVSTHKTDHGVEIMVGDNGGGIPDSIKDKIFQPFFTTKPTGQGTGLGLSMSYDIVTKGHGGALTVASEAGKGTTFTVKLPNWEM